MAITKTRQPVTNSGSSGLSNQSLAEMHEPTSATEIRRLKTRRNPMLVALGGLLVIAGALISVGAYTQLSNAQEVIAVVNPVPRGERLERTDLQIIRVGVDPLLSPLPASQLTSLIGQYAVWDLAKGALLTAGAVGPNVVPHQGQAEVGLALKPGSLPGNSLIIGDQVTIIAVTSNSTSATTFSPGPWPGVVVAISSPDSNRTTVVGVEVATAEAPVIAALSAQGQVALVLESRER